MRLIKQITFIALFLPATLSFALPNTLSCHGYDQTGRRVTAFIDRDTGSIKINGQYVDIAIGELGRSRITTENFRNENGTLVYDTICIQDRIVSINQYDACQQDFMVSAVLCCRKHVDS